MKKEMTDTFFNINWYPKIFWGIGIIEVHAILSLEKVFAKSELIPSINPSITPILSIKNLNIYPQERLLKR